MNYTAMNRTELAIIRASQMKEIRPEINIEKTAKALEKGMTKTELLKAINYSK